MSYTFNYTGRELIDRELINLTVAEQGDKVELTGSLNLTGKKYAGGVVRLEAYRRNQRLSFGCGPAKGVVSLNQSFPRFAPVESIMYVIKVVSEVDPTRGMILAIRNQVRPDHGAEGFLPFVARDLGQELWRLHEDEADIDLPEVQINSRIEDIRALGKDPRFLAIVMPDIARSLGQWLQRQLADEAEGDHIADLLTFFRGLGVSPNGDEDDWIEPAIEAFCNRHAFVDKWLAQEEDA